MLFFLYQQGTRRTEKEMQRITRRHIGRQIRKLNRAQQQGPGQVLDILDNLKKTPDLYWAVKANW